MAKVTMTDELKSFMESQNVYFVATAPLDGNGHINCSPKGGSGSFRVIDENRVAYLDYVGSGIETVAHIKENGRIVVMFASFGERPMIARIHGRGAVVETGSARYDELIGEFPNSFGSRAIIEIDVERVSTSCGYGVPHMSYQMDRSKMGEWLKSKGADGLVDYSKRKNARSIDGLAGLGEE